jgi:DNA repair exonuclease SbcCD ATPase subunit
MTTAKKLDIEIENVGGYKGIHHFTLHPGLNIVKAPNAVGKTSFVRALELMVLDDSELRNKGYYMNLMTDEIRDQARVKFVSDKIIERRFRRTREDLKWIDGNPIYRDGNKVSMVCFALPDNELINRMLTGQSIENYIEEFSESRYYDRAIELVGTLESDFDRKHQLYRSDLIRLEQEQTNIKNDELEKARLEKEKENLPSIDVNKAVEDQKIRQEINRIEGLKRGIDNEAASIRREIIECDSSIERIQSEIEIFDARIKEIGKDQKRINDQLSEIDKFLNRTNIDIKNFDMQLRKTDDEIRMVNENFQKRQQYGEDKICIACGQQLSLAQLQKYESQLKASKEDWGQKLKTANRKREDLEGDQHKLKRELQELATFSDQLKAKQKSKAEKERQKNIQSTKFKEKESQRNTLEKEIEKLYANIDEELLEFVKKKDKLVTLIESAEARVNARKQRIEELKKSEHEADRIVGQIEFTKDAIAHLRKRKEELLDAVRLTFNKRIKEIYQKLGYKDFEDIEIRPDYTVYIRRPGFNDSWPLDALSTSERITLAVTLLIAGKQEYLPDYPFFVLDELVTSYDPERFEKIKEYISHVTDYVVITQLVKSEDVGGKVVIEHIT